MDNRKHLTFPWPSTCKMQHSTFMIHAKSGHDWTCSIQGEMQHAVFYIRTLRLLYNFNTIWYVNHIHVHSTLLWMAMSHVPVFVDSSVDIHRRYNQENQEDYCQHEECNGTPYKDGWKITYVDNPVSIVLFSWGS